MLIIFDVELTKIKIYRVGVRFYHTTCTLRGAFPFLYDIVVRTKHVEENRYGDVRLIEEISSNQMNFVILQYNTKSNEGKVYRGKRCKGQQS